MTIGVDIDDTVANTYQAVKEAIKIKLNHDIDNDENIIYFKNPTVDEFLKEQGDILLPIIKPKENAKEVINKLAKEGHKIYFVTARSSRHFKNPYQSTHDWLIKHGFRFNELIVESNNKEETCDKYNIDVFIDDSIKNCEFIASIGVKAYLFTSDYNELYEYDKRVNSWDDFYNIITTMKEE